MNHQEFLNHREAVKKFVEARMKEQGFDRLQTINATTRIYFFKNRDVENLYRTINSNLEEYVIRAIVAHDFTGLANRDECFLPKSRQFDDETVFTNGPLGTEESVF
jgi:hypothetical protein